MTSTERESGGVARPPCRTDVFAHPRNTGPLFVFLYLAVTLYMENATAFAERFASMEDGEIVVPGSHVPFFVVYGVWWLVFVPEFGWRALRNRGRRPLDPALHPRASRRIDALVSEAGLKRRPRLFVSRRIGGHAFVGGSTKMPVWRPYLVIGPDLLALGDRQDDTARQIFTAVVSHEIGHLRNHDVMLLHLLAGLRCSNVLSTVLFTVLLTLHSDVEDRSELLFGVLTLLLFALLVELIARELLRGREKYADLCAARSRPRELEVAFRLAERKQEHSTSAPRRLGRALLNEWWTCHPPVRARLRLLADPAELLRLPEIYLFFGGLLAGASCVTCAAATTNALHLDAPEKGVFLIMTVLVGAPLGSLVAVGVWRQERYGDSTFARSLADTASRALLLAVGVLIGSRLTPLNPYGDMYDGATLPLEPVLPWSLGALLCGCFALVGWPHLAARVLRLVRPTAGPASRLFWWPLKLMSAVVGCAVFLFLPWFEAMYPAVPTATQWFAP
ncbi:M48 family metalloprotease [Streptomyces sp. NPDC127066]|uniref:M48 family metalloprotease n=1 Tax=Streptomyces sp. NPDC127066 TaxID=3347125 RepID=UPI00365254BA